MTTPNYQPSNFDPEDFSYSPNDMPDPLADVAAGIASLPTTDDPIASLDLPSDDAGDLVPVTARIPISWLEQIDRLRQATNSRMPNIFPTRAKFSRWAHYVGMQELQRAFDRINDPANQLDPILDARLFLERSGGDLAARTATMTEAVDKLQKLAESLEMDIKIAEYEEATRRVNLWLSGASIQTGDYWQRFFVKAIGLVPSLCESLHTLAQLNYIKPDDLLAAAIEQGLGAPKLSKAVLPQPIMKNKSDGSELFNPS